MQANTTDGQWESMNRTWLFLDELRELGKVNGLGDLINKGRSRGVCAVIGFQDYSGLKSAFGEDSTHEITASCAHKLFLRLAGESAEWASRSIGKAEVLETHFSFSSSSGLSMNAGISDSSGKSTSVTNGWSGPHASSSRTVGTQSSRSTSESFGISSTRSISTSTQTRETDVVLASEIAHLPGFDEGNGLTGYLCEYSPDGQSLVHMLRIDKSCFLEVKDSDDPGFVPVAEMKEQDLGYVLRSFRGQVASSST